MTVTAVMEAEDSENKAQNTKLKRKGTVDRDGISLLAPKKKVKGIVLCSTKPSYCLKRGIGSSICDSVALRSQRSLHRKKLRNLLRKLLWSHNFDEACGVLSVLLQGTLREKSLLHNRTKYSATMELLIHVKGDSINQRKIQHVYETWMRKIGLLKRWPLKDRYVAQLEFILFCLTRGNNEDAHQAVICLMQEGKFESDPVSNLVVGFTFYQIWYSSIPKEFQLGDLDESYASFRPERHETRSDISIENFEVHDSIKVQDDSLAFQFSSNTSIRNDKDIILDGDAGQHGEASMEMEAVLHRGNAYQNSQPQGFYLNSNESSGHGGHTFSRDANNMQHTSIFNAPNLETWLLPLRLPHSPEDFKHFIDVHREMHNDHYKNAVKYLRLALHSKPPVHEALLPLIQMLLIGDQVKEAQDEFHEFVQNSDPPLPIRFKASILEHFDSNSIFKLSSCFEESLKEDPCCSYSLARLVSMHQNGAYGAEKMLEMIALHLDATYAEHQIWKEFASGFLKLSQCEEDRMSLCGEGNESGWQGLYSKCFNRIPPMFTDGASGRNWKFRCKFWLTRHFSQKILSSEIEAGDLQLLTYKAACASHLYGREFVYVVKVSACLEEGNDMDLFSFLQMHMLNSVGFYFNYGRKILS